MMKLVSSQPVRLAASLIMVFALVLLSAGCGSANQEPATPSGTGNQARADNNVPVIDAIISEWNAIERDGTGRIKCIAHDPDGDELTYTWEANRGAVSGDGPEVSYTAPSSYVTIIVNVSVYDGMSRAMAGVTFPVVCCGEAQENPEWVE